MERYVTWYILQLKAWCMQKTCWIQVIGMCLLLSVVMCISVPNEENLQIGICNVNGTGAEQILDILEQSDSIFAFQKYADENEMRKDILAGKLECGFSFAENFDAKLKNAKVLDSIKYMETPFSTKGNVARETFYTAFLQVFGEQMLVGSIEDIYGSYDEKIAEELLEKNQDYLNSDIVFHIDQKLVETKGTEERTYGKTYPLQGLVGLFLFGIMFMEHGKKFESGKRNVFRALPAREQRIFEGMGYLAVTTVAAVAGVIWIVCSKDSRGFGVEISRMIIYLIYCSLWILLVGRLFRKQTAFMAWTVTCIVIQIFICPVFVDFSAYMEALHYIGYIFPMGIYL